MRPSRLTTTKLGERNRSVTVHESGAARSPTRPTVFRADRDDRAGMDGARPPTSARTSFRHQVRGMGDGPASAQVRSDERGFGKLHFGGAGLDRFALVDFDAIRTLRGQR